MTSCEEIASNGSKVERELCEGDPSSELSLALPLSERIGKRPTRQIASERSNDADTRSGASQSIERDDIVSRAVICCT